MLISFRKLKGPLPARGDESTRQCSYQWSDPRRVALLEKEGADERETW